MAAHAWHEDKLAFGAAGSHFITTRLLLLLLGLPAAVRLHSDA